MIKKYVEENKDRMLEELFSLIRIPSVSAQPAHKEDMVRCAERWKELLLEACVDKAEVMPSKGNPMVYAERMVDPNAKTVLVYGHYDVIQLSHLNFGRPNHLSQLLRMVISGLVVLMMIRVSRSCRQRHLSILIRMTC